MKKESTTKFSKICTLLLAGAMTVLTFAGCGTSSGSASSPSPSVSASAEASASPSASEAAGLYYGSAATAESVVKDAAGKGKVGNWGLGNEYEIQALLSKYGLPTTFLSQAFDMNGFDDDTIALASAMTYNELGLVKNSYEGGYSYGDKVKTIDMNEEGVAMLEDNIFTTSAFAKANPNTVTAFLYASLKGWEYAVANPEEAAEICYKYGSSVSADHQAYMADEVEKLVTTDTKGSAVSKIGNMDEAAMQQTLDLAKKYIKLDDSVAASKLQSLTLDDIRDTSYWAAASASTDGKFGAPEKTDISIQLKWLPDAQFMGYYVALDKGYYKDVGLNVTIVPGGGDISETTAVNSGQVDFGVTWVSNLIAANAGGMSLTEVAQIFQRSGLVLVYKING
ncbi:NitT/TauT family transport system substrate-binding protein [Sporobacter termitidis DSM 10068]|uniref:Thiamine pyrimidine synthase n=1 Tax=Sporobacter termitidis DSM 10068 TaxID=1123282 RepID=A0A1M5YLE3_9FIRM|nr:ABC transporter substrate-binding protein [Sporobacter termitidis]SHI12363.1 NitT/TauT family transport system substrate-binding protein [Sporobacter termitidis DSM 10068]